MFLSLTTLFKALSFLPMSKGYHIGSEFWSLPQHYGDEMSGITATLTQTEQGRQKPITHVAQPRSIRQEAGTWRRQHCRFFPFSLVLSPVLSDFAFTRKHKPTGVWKQNPTYSVK